MQPLFGMNNDKTRCTAARKLMVESGRLFCRGRSKHPRLHPPDWRINWQNCGGKYGRSLALSAPLQRHRTEGSSQVQALSERMDMTQTTKLQ
jgi:hypothetical protein